MKLLFKLKDMCYYEYNGEIVWVKNKKPCDNMTVKVAKAQYYFPQIEEVFNV